MTGSSAQTLDEVADGHRLRWEPARQFPGKPELAVQISLLQESVERAPRRANLRCGLAVALADAGRNDDALEQWQTAAQISAHEPMVRHGLAKALLKCNRPIEAISLLEKLRDDIGRVETKIDMTYGSALEQGGRSAEALAIYQKQLESDPTNDNALYGATRLLTRAENAAGALELVESLHGRGIRTTRMLVEHVTLLRLLWRHAEAAALEGIGQFLQTAVLPVPEGWRDRNALNAALAVELRAHPGRRFENPRQRTRGGWRIDALNFSAYPALAALFTSIRVCIDQYVERLMVAAPHPFVDFMPESVRLAAWAIWLNADAYQEWHVHPHGWLSGVYYVAVPEGVSGTQGALTFGTPVLADMGTSIPGYCTWRLPSSGQLVLFPSHCYHRTLPTKAAAERISIAFDVMPAVDLAASASLSTSTSAG